MLLYEKSSILFTNIFKSLLISYLANSIDDPSFPIHFLEKFSSVIISHRFLFCLLQRNRFSLFLHMITRKSPLHKVSKFILCLK